MSTATATMTEEQIESLRDIAIYHGTIAERARKESKSDAIAEPFRHAAAEASKMHHGWAETLTLAANDCAATLAALRESEGIPA